MRSGATRWLRSVSLIAHEGDAGPWQGRRGRSRRCWRGREAGASTAASAAACASISIDGRIAAAACASASIDCRFASACRIISSPVMMRPLVAPGRQDRQAPSIAHTGTVRKPGGMFWRRGDKSTGGGRAIPEQPRIWARQRRRATPNVNPKVGGSESESDPACPASAYPPDTAAVRVTRCTRGVRFRRQTDQRMCRRSRIRRTAGRA